MKHKNDVNSSLYHVWKREISVLVQNLQLKEQFKNLFERCPRTATFAQFVVLEQAQYTNLISAVLVSSVRVRCVN